MLRDFQALNCFSELHRSKRDEEVGNAAPLNDLKIKIYTSYKRKRLQIIFTVSKTLPTQTIQRFYKSLKLIEEGESKREELSLLLQLEPDFSVKYRGTNPSKGLVEQNTPKS